MCLHSQETHISNCEERGPPTMYLGIVMIHLEEKVRLRNKGASDQH